MGSVNQELYGPPTHLSWGIRIECANRSDGWPCTRYPEATTGFQPLFLYESLSGVLGALVLLQVARRWGPRMRPGDLFLGWLAWYALVRLALEGLRSGNWTVGGVPTATVVSAVLAGGALAVLAWRHRPGGRVWIWRWIWPATLTPATKSTTSTLSTSSSPPNRGGTRKP